MFYNKHGIEKGKKLAERGDKGGHARPAGLLEIGGGSVGQIGKSSFRRRTT